MATSDLAGPGPAAEDPPADSLPLRPPPLPPEPPRRRWTFGLGGLFMFMAVCGVLSAVIASGVRDFEKPGDKELFGLIARGVVGTILGVVVGACVGVSYDLGAGGGVLACVGGFVLGGAIGVLSMLPFSPWLAVAGTPALLLLAWLLRWRHPPPPVHNE